MGARVLFAADREGGVRVDQVISRSLREEVEAARLIAALQPELSKLDEAVRAHFARAGKHGTSRRPALTLVPTKT